jgi:hypothetical protein
MQELDKSGVSVQLDGIITNLYAAIPDQKGHIQSEVELFISWGKDVPSNRHKIVRFILTNMQPGMSAMARHVRALCHSVPRMKDFCEQVKKELAQLEKGLDSNSIDGCRKQLDDTACMKFTSAQNQICNIDQRMGAICRAIDSCVCPKITVALSLFHSGADFDNDDIVDFLKRSQKDDINDALAHINEDEHTKIQTCIAKLTGLLALLDRVGDGLNKIRDDLNNELEMAQSFVQEMQADVRSLRSRLSDPTIGEPNLVSNLDTALREARDLLQKADSQRIIEAFRILQPEYPEQGSSSHDSIVAVSRLLAQLKDPSVKTTLATLDRAKTYDEALKVVGAIEQITSIDTDDVVTLLKSDQRKEESSTRSDSTAVGAMIAGIKRSTLKEGDLAAPDHLFKLARMPDLELPLENVHILGDFVGQGLLFDIGDGVLFGIPSQERAQIERSETKGEQSERVVRAIRDHFKTHYLDKDETGAHYFICNLKRPSNHWIKVALVKIKGKKPLLTLLDSKNYPIHPDPNSEQVGTDTVLAFLYEKFLRSLSSSQK